MEFNPLSNLSLAGSDSLLRLAISAKKTIYPLYLAMDLKYQLTQQIIVFLAIGQLGSLYLRVTMPCTYNISLQKWGMFYDGYVLIFAIASNINAFLDADNHESMSFYYSFIIAPVFGYICAYILEYLVIDNCKKDIRIFKKEDDWIEYIMALTSLVYQRRNNTYMLDLDGILKFHNENCEIKNCNCSDLILHVENEDDLKFDRKIEWYKFIECLILDVIEKQPNMPKIHLLYGYILYKKLNNKYKAIYHITIADSYNKSVFDNFSIYRYSRLIEFEFSQIDEKLTEEKGFSVNSLVYFNDLFVEFQKFLYKTVNVSLEFWSELLEKNPDMLKLITLGNQLIALKDKAEEMFNRLSKIGPTHIKNLILYSNFLKSIIADETKSKILIDKANQIIAKQYNKNIISLENGKSKYNSNSITCIIVVSGSVNTLGNVITVNSDLKKLYGYKNSDITGYNINKVMPKAYERVHDIFMKDFFTRDVNEESSNTHYGAKKFQNLFFLERIIFPVNKHGYLVPSNLMIKLLPELDKGIKVVGFLNECDEYLKNKRKNHYMLIDLDSGALLGITKL